MTRPRKSAAEAASIGTKLRERRRKRFLTLQAVSEDLGIDVGQLSRFERGDFTFVTPKLQAFADFLQIPTEPKVTTWQLAHRFEAVAKRSYRHEAAARALLQALEALK